MIQLNIHRFHFSLFLLSILLAQYYTSGYKIVISTRTRSKSEGDLSLSHERNELPQRIDTFQGSNQHQSSFIGALRDSNQGFQVEQINQRLEVHPSMNHQDTLDSGDLGRGHYSDSISSIIDRIIDGYPLKSNIPVKPEVSSIVNELIASALDSSHSSDLELSNVIDDLFDSGFARLNVLSSEKNHNTPVREDAGHSSDPNTLKSAYPIREVIVEPHEFLRDLPEEDPNMMVELMPESGVMINRAKLEEILKLHRTKPKLLLRRLFNELIPVSELATMQSTNRNGYKSIPINIRLAVEGFIEIKAEPNLSRETFMRTLTEYLKYLRLTHRVDKVKTSEEVILMDGDLPTNPNSMVELTQGSGVMINKKAFNSIVTLFRYRPRQMLRKLISELIPPEELAVMQSTSRNNFKFIPEVTLYAVEAVVMSLGIPQMSRNEFMRVLKHHLNYLRKVHRVDKIKLTKTK